ncbi:hypothetical protein HHI36_012274 [Cryptolaemus montrouzieri]|uniref:Uncharacterized protein n=1 Tax=Cryptolaemus montrouzieri TaxID=559131 RepID=A0ABD2NDT6_9CUCU
MNEMFIGAPPSSVIVTDGGNEPERRNCGMHNFRYSLVVRQVEADDIVSVIWTLKNTKSVGMDVFLIEALKFVAGLLEAFKETQEEVRDTTNVARVQQLLDVDHKLNIKIDAKELNLSSTLVYRIVTEDLAMRKNEVNNIQDILKRSGYETAGHGPLLFLFIHEAEENYEKRSIDEMKTELLKDQAIKKESSRSAFYIGKMPTQVNSICEDLLRYQDSDVTLIYK